MWIVLYTWDIDEELQYWQESRFESAYEAELFVISLMDDGIAATKTFKEPFKR